MNSLPPFPKGPKIYMHQSKEYRIPPAPKPHRIKLIIERKENYTIDLFKDNPDTEKAKVDSAETKIFVKMRTGFWRRSWSKIKNSLKTDKLTKTSMIQKISKSEAVLSTETLGEIEGSLKSKEIVKEKKKSRGIKKFIISIFKRKVREPRDTTYHPPVRKRIVRVQTKYNVESEWDE